MRQQADLTTSGVMRLIANNVCKTQRGIRPAGAAYVDVQIVRSRLVVATLVVNEIRAVCFAATFTVKGWKPLPSMTVLDRTRTHTDADATNAVQALFAQVQR